MFLDRVKAQGLPSFAEGPWAAWFGAWLGKPRDWTAVNEVMPPNWQLPQEAMGILRSVSPEILQAAKSESYCSRGGEVSCSGKNFHMLCRDVLMSRHTAPPSEWKRAEYTPKSKETNLSLWDLRIVSQFLKLDSRVLLLVQAQDLTAADVEVLGPTERMQGWHRASFDHSAVLVRMLDVAAEDCVVSDSRRTGGYIDPDRCGLESINGLTKRSV